MGRMPEGRLRVAVLAGGSSSERDVSLISGAHVADALQAAGHQVDLIDPAETDLAKLDWDRFDGCFLALHGGEGEDGRIQAKLSQWHVPYTGSGPTASRIAMSKSAAKQVFLQAGIPTPGCVVIDRDVPAEVAVREIRMLGFPVVVKPDAQGSSLGVAVAWSTEQVAGHLTVAHRFDQLALAERFIAGREFTVAVLGRKPLPLLEIVGREEIFDYHSKYSSSVIEYHFDTGLSPMKIQELQRTAANAAAALGTAGLVRVDLMLDDCLRPWVLEINTLPGMTDRSMAPKAAAEIGLDLPALCDWILRDGLSSTTKSERYGSLQERPFAGPLPARAA